MWRLSISKEPAPFCWGYLKGCSLPARIRASRAEAQFIYIFFLLLGYKGIVRGKRDVAETQLRNGNLDETVAGSLSPLCNSTQTLAEQLHA